MSLRPLSTALQSLETSELSLTSLFLIKIIPWHLGLLRIKIKTAKSSEVVSYGVLRVILRLAILVQCRLVTDRRRDTGSDRHTTTAYTAIA